MSDNDTDNTSLFRRCPIPYNDDRVIPVATAGDSIIGGVSIAESRIRHMRAEHINEWHTRYALCVLDATEGDGNFDDDAVAELAKALRPQADELARKLTEECKQLGELSPGRYLTSFPATMSEFVEYSRDGMFLLDAVFLDHVEATGQRGEEIARKGRVKARERWSGFHEWLSSIEEWEDIFEPPDVNPLKLWKHADRKILPSSSTKSSHEHLFMCSAFYYLASALWKDRVRERWVRPRKQRPALAMPVHRKLEGAALRRGRKTVEANNQLQLWSVDDELLAHTALLPEQRLTTILRTGTDDLQSITAVRLLVYLIRKTHIRHFSYEQQPRVHRFEGGYSALSKAIGETSSSGVDKLPGILDAGRRWDIEWDGGGSYGLWSYEHRDKTGPGLRSELEITVGAPLSPNYVNGLKPGERILVPIVELVPSSALAPGPRTYGAQAAFQQAVVRAIVERRQQVYEHGGAHLPLDELWRIAQPLGLTKKTMGRAIERWKSPGEDGPVFLEEVERDRYHLADNELYSLERRFIDQTAELTKQNSERGKKSARKRNSLDD